MNGLRKPRQRRILRNPIESAVLRATTLTSAEVKELMAPLQTCARFLRQGVATQDQHTVLHTTFCIAQGIENSGIVRGLQEHISAADHAMEAIGQRANATGRWKPTALHYYELEAINTMLDLHEFQIRKLSAGELHQVVQKIINTTQSTGGNVRRADACALGLTTTQQRVAHG